MYDNNNIIESRKLSDFSLINNVESVISLLLLFRKQNTDHSFCDRQLPSSPLLECYVMILRAFLKNWQLWGAERFGKESCSCAFGSVVFTGKRPRARSILSWSKNSGYLFMNWIPRLSFFFARRLLNMTASNQVIFRTMRVRSSIFIFFSLKII